MNGPERFVLAPWPTPLVAARRAGLLIKRDDLGGFAGAGHKARQLEFLVGAARRAGCDVLVTGGGPGSNFCAAAAAAAAVAGLGCELVYYGAPPEGVHPNLAAARTCGARTRFTGDPDRARIDAVVMEVAAEMSAAGHRPYPMPRGGATAVGAVGMVLAAGELAAQVDALGVEPEVVVVATGSGGACAGLAVGTAVHGRPWRVLGASVSRPLEEARAQVRDLARDTAALLDVAPSADTTVELIDARGPGFGVASDEGDAATRVALRTEAILLDPVYTAKAFAVVLRLMEDDVTGPVVFWHTGGLLTAVHHLAGIADVEARA